MAEVSCRYGILRSGAQPIVDPEIERTIGSMVVGDINGMLYDDGFVETFLDSYDAWIRSSTLNSIRGLDAHGRFMCFAVTHAIEQFLMKHRDRRVMTFDGEYPGTTELIRCNGMRHGSLDHGCVERGDAVIISAPFSGSGNVHPRMAEVIDRCRMIGVPVMVDCAFFGICRNLDLDVGDGIETVAFSLSKCYGLQNHRVGMVYSKEPPCGIELLQRFGYTARFGAAIAMGLFEVYGPDRACMRYGRAQANICRELGSMAPSDTVIFGNGTGGWDMFNRGGGWNRVCIADFLADHTDEQGDAAWPNG